MKDRFTFDKLIFKIIDTYSTYLHEKHLRDPSKSNIVIDSIRFLKTLNHPRDFSTLTVPFEQIHNFLRILLNVVGLLSATGGSLTSSDFGDIKSIGRKKDIVGVLLGKTDQIHDWMCSILFQGWVSRKKPHFSISEDLRYVLPKNLNTCDFELKGDSIVPTLVECKRIHPNISMETYDLALSSIIHKLNNDIFLKANKQFSATEIYLGKGSFYKHLILDIGSYGYTTVADFGDMKIVGLQETKEIATTINELNHLSISNIDEITLCWFNTFFFHNIPRAIAYYTKALKIGHKVKYELGYSGWTVEFYPRGKEIEYFRELRVSTAARSASWIKASWYSSTDNLITFTRF